MKQKGIGVFLGVLLTSLFSKAVNYNQFTRSNSLTFEKIVDARTKKGHVKNDHDLILSLGYSFVEEPLIVKDNANSTNEYTVIKDMESVHFGAAYYFKPWFMLGLTGAYSKFEDDQGSQHKGLTDIELSGKFRLANNRKSAFSVVPYLSLPLNQGEFTTSGSAPYPVSNLSLKALSDESLGYGTKLVYERIFKHFQLVLNAGYRYSKDAKDETSVTPPPGTPKTQIDMTQRLMAGAGVYVPLASSWGVNAEWVKYWSNPFFSGDIDPNEFFLGVSGGLTQRLHVFGGLGFGNTFIGADGNDFRASFGLKYMGHVRSKRVQPLVALSAKELEPFSNALHKEKKCEDRYVFNDSNVFVIRFKNNQFKIKKNHKQLQDLVSQMKARVDDIKIIEVAGHTSASGSAAYNLKLSKKRAEYFKGKLVEMGLPENKVQTKGYGEEQLLDLNAGPASDLVNRRVEFIVHVAEKYKGCFP